MAIERRGDPVHANQMFDSLLFGDPGVQLDEIREEYRLVARDEARRYPSSPNVRLWGNHPMEVARCLVMRIDPESGDDIETPMSLMERYRMRGLYGEVMAQYEGLMNQPAVINALSHDGLPKLY